MSKSDKVMFEIYREVTYNRRYRVVFFTELDEHNKDIEISRALAGEHYYDGFLRTETLADSKRVIGDLVDQLNRGASIVMEEAVRRLHTFEA